MTRARVAVPSSPSDVGAWATDFKARFGVLPIAGGETPGGGTATATPPAPTPAAPAQPAATPPAAPAPQPGGTPAAPAAVPPAPGAPEGTPGQPDPAAARPEWIDDIFSRLDEMAGPTPVDPLAVELGLAPAPPAVPGLDPANAVPGQPQPQPGFPTSQPGQAPPAQAAAGLPGQPPPQGQPDERELIQRFIDERAAEQAERLIRERVDPVLQAQAMDRRRAEGAALVNEYPELRDQGNVQALVQRARTWSQTILGSPDAAGEPGFLELVLLASKGLEAAGGETPATPGALEVPIEQPGPASPGAATTPETELVERIKGAKAGGGLSSVFV